jgi:hypothetical protein
MFANPVMTRPARQGLPAVTYYFKLSPSLRTAGPEPVSYRAGRTTSSQPDREGYLAIKVIQAVVERPSAALSGRLTISAAWREVALYSSRRHPSKILGRLLIIFAFFRLMKSVIITPQNFRGGNADEDTRIPG